jgi:hypothetical protein
MNSNEFENNLKKLSKRSLYSQGVFRLYRLSELYCEKGQCVSQPDRPNRKVVLTDGVYLASKMAFAKISTGMIRWAAMETVTGCQKYDS